MTEAAERARALLEIAAEQEGLLSRAQLNAAGMPWQIVRNHVAAGRWSLVGRQVVALQTGRLTGRQLLWFAVLESEDECLIAGLSALSEYGLVGFEVDRPHCAVGLGGRSKRTAHFVRRQSRRLTRGVVHPARQPQMMRIGPALIDALENMTSRPRQCALLAAVVQQRLFRGDELRPLLSPERTLPGRRLLLLVAGDIEGGAHSLLEIDFGRLCRRAGLPPPRRQVIRTDARGRRRYLDADFEGFAVEVDGAAHLKPLAWWDDMWRQNDIVIGGKPVLRFPSVGIRLDPNRVIDQLVRAALRFNPHLK